MANQSSAPVTIGAPDAWNGDARMISHWRANWESIQVTPTEDDGRLVEIIVNDVVVFRARLNADAALHLAKLLAK